MKTTQLGPLAATWLALAMPLACVYSEMKVEPEPDSIAGQAGLSQGGEASDDGGESQGGAGSPSHGGTSQSAGGKSLGGAVSGGSPSHGGTSQSAGGKSLGGAVSGGSPSDGGTSQGGAVSGGSPSHGGTSQSAGGSPSDGGTSQGGAVSGGSPSRGGTSQSAGGSPSDGGTAPSAGGNSLGGAVSGGSPSDGGTAPSAGASGAETGCSGLHESMVPSLQLCVATTATIEGPLGVASYEIDTTEVTRGQYQAWLASSPAPPAATDVSCSANTSYTASTSCMSSAKVCKEDCDNHPVVCVDWCDAQAYCTAVGKRLCGRIGGGSNLLVERANVDTSQWYRACSAAESNLYPYGDSYTADACNGNEYWPSTARNTTLSVATLTSCQSPTTGYAGTYDLAGNVMEWEDGCASTGPSSSCSLRGGAFEDFANAMTCGYGFSYTRTTTDPRIGFRCCSN